MKGMLCPLVLALSLWPASARAAIDIEPYLRKDRFEDIKLSPTGEYLALTAPLEDRTVLVVMRRADRKLTAKLAGGKNTVISDFWWANDERVVASMAEKLGTLERPITNGELHAVNADGSGGKLLVQHDVDNYLKGEPLRAADLIDTYDKDAKQVLIATSTLTSTPQTQIERLQVYTGRRSVIAKAPVRRARFAVDPQGRVRFALGTESDNANNLYYRVDDDADWQLLNDEDSSHRVEVPLGFSSDGGTAYLQVEQDSGPDAVVALDLTTRERRVLLRDADVDPYRILRDPATQAPVGAAFMRARLETRFFDEESPTAQRYRMLERAFPDKAVLITSASRDGRLVVIKVWSDRSPGDVYLFDSETRRADRLFSYREWLDPTKMAGTDGVQFDARDGLRLHGYLTRPADATAGARLPLVILPHGGPFGLFDTWDFDAESQMLAAAGYAVLRVNYRGSGNYGRAHQAAGAGEWGGKMQDDLTDATRWAVDQGIADPERICIYGGSYGAYAALMGVAKEPGLYRCAVGYVGVYDLPMLHDNQSSRSRWVGRWADDWIGDPDQLTAVSPTHLSERVKVPVFLAAGGEDRTAPIGHSKRMEEALKASGTPVETLYFPTEGHGFYSPAHRHEFYTRLLAFLARHLHGQTAEPAAP